MGEALFQRIYAAGVVLIDLQRQRAATSSLLLELAIDEARFAFTRRLMAFDGATYAEVHRN